MNAITRSREFRWLSSWRCLFGGCAREVSNLSEYFLSEIVHLTSKLNRNVRRGYAVSLSDLMTRSEQEGFAATLLSAGALGFTRMCLSFKRGGSGCIITPAAYGAPF